MKTKSIYKQQKEKRDEYRARKEEEILTIMQKDNVSRAVAQKRRSQEVDAKAKKAWTEIFRELFTYFKEKNIPYEQAALLCGINARTVRRWSKSPPESTPKSQAVKDRIFALIRLGSKKLTL